MSATLPACPQCQSAFVYADGPLLICPECAHEWPADAAPAPDEDAPAVIKDAVGNVLQDGDSVTVIKDLKLKGSSLVVKVGTKVRNIKLSQVTTILTAASTALAPCSSNPSM